MIWTIIIPQPRTLIINVGNVKTTNGMSSNALSLSLMKQNFKSHHKPFILDSQSGPLGSYAQHLY